ncbi:MAG: hypothetical protein QM534_03710 [Sediminibacterium sp.]|nr:hypothetical protein [Sediminibacterium sp.]
MEFDLEMYRAEWQNRTLNTVSVKVNKHLPDDAGRLIRRMKQAQVKQFVLYLITLFAIMLVDRSITGVISTSKAGYYILLGCALYYVFLKLFLLARLQTIRLSDSVTETVRKVKASRRFRQYVLMYAEWLYSSVLSVGVYLYLQPVFEKMVYTDPDREYVVYLVMLSYLAWASFYTFYIKRREIKRELQHLDSIMAQLNS